MERSRHVADVRQQPQYRWAFGTALCVVALGATLASSVLLRPAAVAAQAGSPPAQTSPIRETPPPPAPPARVAIRQAAPPSGELLSKYCVTCHNERLRTAGLALDPADLADIAHDPAVWEKVARKLRTGAMPPAGRPRPEPAAGAAVPPGPQAGLAPAAPRPPEPGRPGVHPLYPA